MTSIATLGPEGSPAWQAARLYRPAATINLYPNINAVISAFEQKEADYAIIPVYNTREGEIKEYFHTMENLARGFWVDNIVLPIHLSLGTFGDGKNLTMIVGDLQILKQCEEFIARHFGGIGLLSVQDIEQSITEIKNANRTDQAIIGPEDMLKRHGLTIIEKEVASHNRTRFAVLGAEKSKSSGYDATALITTPLRDRVGLLFDTLGEFTKRGINLLDLRSETDIKSQRMQFYIEAEGHMQDDAMRQALANIESNVIQEPGTIKILGSYPRVDMRAKIIQTAGFIGSGEMSKWFTKKLENESYKTIITGRSSKISSEEMIKQVEIVLICVPISVTADTIRQYGPLLKDGQALIILAGEAENSLNTALACCRPGVEIMLVHNLWGPQAINMKDKNASVVRTSRSGALCSEFESFLYKHGAKISHDTPWEHDLMMGVGQKLPTVISTAMAMAMQENKIKPEDIGSHSTLTSLYGILAMCRLHSQNARTYAEIMASKGEGRKIVRDFSKNLLILLEMAENEKITELCEIIDRNRKYLTEEFLNARMRQALAVDETLGKAILSK
ncbi:MAG: prephenate dehydrogenase/arogenate dehydrogenase family protein [Proteobacteria bacterium]|nr:prephenate dehydrogenase/arogenate dehydrogenase family protein [Pseudomonadota bacterium]MBU1714437.1 prephenate dehydrogenase/arogenate dehydrogenase family protein [Pseudomonadota bacterium]